jgi:hypothetical protein
VKRFLSIDDLQTMPAPAWLIDGMFEVNSLVMLAGPPAAYKSFLALDWVLSMATKRDWHGKRTAPARVLYVLGEGKASLLKRVETWCTYHNIDGKERQLLQENFRVSFEVPQMAVKSSVDNLLAGLTAEGFSPTVIVIDTFARSFVGLDENSQKDTGMWVESADRLRQQGYTVIFLHHTAKNTEFGLKYRGSSAIMGAMDTAFTLQRDGNSHERSQLACIKQKDHDEGAPLYFQRLIVRADGDEGSIVLVPTIKVDERFTPEYREKEEKIEKAILGLLKDEAFSTDAERGRALSAQTGMTEGASIVRLHRRKKLLQMS